MFVGCGLHKDVVAHPQSYASYAVPVRPDRTLVVPLLSDFRSPGTPLRLTNGLRQLAHKGLAPYG